MAWGGEAAGAPARFPGLSPAYARMSSTNSDAGPTYFVDDLCGIVSLLFAESDVPRVSSF